MLMFLFLGLMCFSSLIERIAHLTRISRSGGTSREGDEIELVEY